MKTLIVALILALGIPANAQSFALKSAAKTVHGSQPKTFNREMKIDFAVAVGIRSADAARTCWNLAHGGRELSIPSQNCAVIVGWSYASAGVGLAAAYELSKHGHRKLARVAQYAIVAPSAYGALRSFGVGGGYGK